MPFEVLLDFRHESSARPIQLSWVVRHTQTARMNNDPTNCAHLQRKQRAVFISNLEIVLTED